jgi:hypothetical protein
LPGEQATIGKSLFIKGEITGSESLFVDGKVEGSINLAGNRVTVGRNGQVAASITAREIVSWARFAATSPRPTAWTSAPKVRSAAMSPQPASALKMAPSSRAASTFASRRASRWGLVCFHPGVPPVFSKLDSSEAKSRNISKFHGRKVGIKYIRAFVKDRN